MSSLKQINFSAGHTDTIDTSTNNGQPFVAPRGATLGSYTASVEDASLAAPLQFFKDYKAPANKNSQRLTLPSLNVSSRNEIVIPIFASDKGLFRIAGATGVQSSNTKYEQIWDAAQDESLGVFTFSSATNGEEKIDLTGVVTVAKYGSAASSTAHGATEITAGGTGGGIINDAIGDGYLGEDAGTVAGYANGMTTSDTIGTANTISKFPVFRVKSTIPAGTSFATFRIMAGQPLPDDETMINIENGSPVKFSEMDSLVDGAGKLLSDYTVDSSKMSFIKDFSSYGISLDAGVSVPENMKVELFKDTNSTATKADGSDVSSTAPTLTLGQIETGATVAAGEKYLFYLYNESPRFELHLPKGFRIDQQFEIPAGTSIVGGFTLPEETLFPAVQELYGAHASTSDAVKLENVVLQPGFQLFNGVDIQSAIPDLAKSFVRAGMTSRSVAQLPVSSSTESPLALEHGVMFAAGDRLPSAMTLNETNKTKADINLSAGSELAEGTILPSGSGSLDGALVNESISVDSSSLVTEEYDMNVPFTVNGNTELVAGTILKNPTLPIGFTFPANTILPALVRILTSMNYTMGPSTEIPAQSVLGGGFTMYGDIGMNPKGVIPAQTSITGAFKLPAQSKLHAGAVFANNDVAVPSGTSFKAGDVLPKGTVFDADAQLPADFNIESQIPGATVGTTAERQSGKPLAMIVNGADKYIRVAQHSGLLAGLFLRKGTVISNYTGGLVTGVDTGSYAEATNTVGAVVMTLDPAEYSLSSTLSPAGEKLEIKAGEPTSVDIYLLADYSLDREILIPFQGERGILSKVKIASELTLLQDLVLTAPLKITSSLPLKWPRGHALAVDFILAKDTDFGGSGISTYLTKDIDLNVASTDDFIHGIFGAGSVIKFPAQPYKLLTAIRTSDDSVEGKLVVGTATNYKPARSSLDLPKGAKLGGPVKLIAQLTVAGNYVVNATVLNTQNPHKFTAAGGIRLPVGASFPGTVIIPAKSPLPKGITLPVAVTLAARYVISKGSNSANNAFLYTLPVDTQLGAGSVLAEDTEFPSGHVFNVPVVIAPFSSLRTNNRFAVFGGEQINTDVQHYQFFGLQDAAQLFSELGFNTSGLIDRVKQLEALLQSIQEQLLAR